MDLARRILEGIQEVELQVTPEFQKPWYDRGEGSFEKPKVSSDDKGTVWWDFGQALILVARFYPSKKRMDVIGHASSVDARMDELMKMFSWVRDKYTDYNIVVHGGNADAGDMNDLQNAGMIDEFVPESGRERNDSDTSGGPFVVMGEGGPKSIDLGTHDSVNYAEGVGMKWKQQEVAESGDPEKAEEVYSWTVFNAENTRVSSG